MGAVAPVNTVLWGENFAHFGTNTPSNAKTGTGTTIYDGASITYAQSSTKTKGYNEALAGGTAPELLLSQSNQTWTISGIKTGGATQMSLTFLSNKTTFNVTVSSTNLSVSGSQKSWTISLKDGQSTPETFDLIIKNTGSSNARIDNVSLKVTVAGTSSATPVDPTVSFNDASYTVGQTLDLSSLWTSNSTGEVTYTVANAGTTGASISGSLFTATAVGTCTVKASQAATSAYNAIEKTTTITVTAPTPATITISEAGQEKTVEGKYVGDSYELPLTSTQTCGTKTFVGWSTETIAKSVNRPTTKFYEPGTEITLAKSQTFYAVFAEGDGSDILTSITGGDWSNGIPTGTWSTKGTGTYSGNGVKFDDANDYVMSPDISSKAYTRLLLKFKSGHNGGEGSVLAFYVYNASNTLLTGDNVTISPETVVPKNDYTNQQTTYQVSVSANEVIGKIMIRMDSKTKNLGMKYCELFGVSSSYQNYTTECTAPCTEPSLLYATPSVTKTVGDAAFINSLTNTKNVSVTYTSTNTSVATVANNGQVTILATGTTTIKATWEGNATYCEDEASYTLTVNPKTYTITVANNISNGSVSADKSSAVEGATIKLTATPNTGYKLDTWNVKDASNNSVSVNASGEFTMPASNVTISATFVSLPKLATPSNLSATEINPTSAKLSWEWSETTNTDLLNYY